ncbi:hypothetical protein BC938DRAFT_472433 [Jimgerdemannia flammicorona]|uniref:Uncharacterized protein n=1 Tax=Jimgerdemannia flammicorona TaxID=994334 RepID=A0A433Q655_9FUNG|nr:hypothetical protein BC938DRAFT_472433 [Jimgerdemannia flammicorona]
MCIHFRRCLCSIPALGFGLCLTSPSVTALLFRASATLLSLARDDRIIIQGGDLGPLVGVSGVADIGVLDMKASNLSWYIPSTTGPAASPRVAHSAVIVGTIAFILFGQTDNTTVDNNIYALDTNTWTWLSTYNPSHLEYTDTGNIAPIPTSNDTVPEMLIPTYTVIIIAVSAGVVALLLIAAVVCCIVYNRRNNKKTDAAADAVATTNAALSLGNPQLPVTQVKNENTSQRNSIASWPSRSQNGGYDSDNLMRSPHSANTNISTPSNNTSYRLSYPPAGPVFHPATTPMYVVDPNVPNVQNMPYAPAAYGHPGYPNGAGMVSPVVYNPYPSYAPFYGYPVGHPSSVPLSMAPSDGGRYFPPNAMSPTLQSTSSQHTSSPEQRHESEHRESAGSSVDTTSTVPIVSGVPVVSNVRSSLTEPYRGEGDEREERL